MNRETKRKVNSDSLTVSKSVLIEEIRSYIQSNPTEDLSLSALENRFGISRFTIQKSFREIMGISPRKYLEECRIQKLKGNQEAEKPIPKAIYPAGYNTLNWPYETPTSRPDRLSSRHRKGVRRTNIRYLTSKCRLGYLLVAETERGICSISLADKEDELVSGLFREYPNAKIERSENVRKRIDSVLNYFEGQLLNLPVDVGGTDFQRRVWSALLRIPYGETRSYNQVAEMIGKPKAVRAVGNACASNPVPLIIPCHRVLRKDGGIGGYGLGIERKKYLLAMEKSSSKSSQMSHANDAQDL